MSFEDVECLKNAFTVYNLSTVPPPPPSETKPLLVIRKRIVTYTRVVVTPPVYGAKHHFRMLIRSLVSKLKIGSGVNN
jgi:hypothetical protein